METRKRKIWQLEISIKGFCTGELCALVCFFDWLDGERGQHQVGVLLSCVLSWCAFLACLQVDCLTLSV